MYGQFTLETLLATAFGRKMNVQRGESDDLVEVLSEFLGRPTAKRQSEVQPRISLDQILVILSELIGLLYLVAIYSAIIIMNKCYFFIISAR